MLKYMCRDGFSSKNPIVAWKFLEDLVEKIMRWETTRYDSLRYRIISAKGDMHAILNSSHIESTFAALENQLKELTI